ncbi:hypothetical protein [Faecalicatena contorta]|uniref:Uncharacterized protein n=1 Tax=Faecalicatena contorta TaxID=39482 RepID=A0A315ZV24_9FIRM|nr:hypothetical protein [Faecalicatena contorta]PWJ49162.1 hypothetical protein A8805_10892 [Faecalicatena contorta]SUQ14867.1 hypothetical protein SAMN05216529_10892 [Faecalicatena contorta]
MTRREMRINEIMDEMKIEKDVAEQLFMDELEELYPDVDDMEVRELVYETKPEKDGPGLVIEFPETVVKVERGEITKSNVQAVSDYLIELPLNAAESKNLVDLLVEMLTGAEKEQFLNGFTMACQAVKNGELPELLEKEMNFQE